MAFEKKKDLEHNDGMISDTGNWNVAADYSKYKILRPLVLVDEYEEIALFGTGSLLQEMAGLFNKDELRLNGLKRLTHMLILIIDNTIFAVKKDREELEGYRRKLKDVLEIFPHLSKNVTDQRKSTNTIKLYHDKFDQVLEVVQDVKSKLNTPLNNNDLIFTKTEEFDPMAYKAEIIRNASEIG